MATLPIKLNDGTTIPWLAFGSGTALFGNEVSQDVERAIKAGFRHIDAAQMYKNEDSVGAGIKAAGVPRTELYVTTKLAELKPGETVTASLKESLRKLQLDYVDLFLIHLPTQHPDLKAVWKGLEEAKAAGLTKSIGVSNFTPKYLRTVLDGATVVPAVNQVRTWLQSTAGKTLKIPRARLNTTRMCSPRPWRRSTCKRSTTSSRRLSAA